MKKWTRAGAVAALCLVALAAAPPAARSGLALQSPVAAAPPGDSMRTLVNVRMKMRDGVELAADVFLPAAPGRYPVLLERTPYLRARDRNAALGEEWARRGYAFVKQDVRGRGDSGGSTRSCPTTTRTASTPSSGWPPRNGPTARWE
jgi:predicted acyl esterase